MRDGGWPAGDSVALQFRGFIGTSYRRRPVSRILDIKDVVSCLEFLDSGFRRNDELEPGISHPIFGPPSLERYPVTTDCFHGYLAYAIMGLQSLGQLSIAAHTRLTPTCLR